MNPSRSRYCLALATALVFSMVLPASQAAGTVDQEPHGLMGVTTGFAFHTGKMYVVDATSGASNPEEKDVYYESTFAGGAYFDFGLPTSARGFDGTVGLRLSAETSAPGPFYAFTFLPRYRWKLDRGGEGLLSVDPWLGFGAEFVFKDKLQGQPFWEFPVALGVDLRVISEKLYLTFELDINLLNPWGPAWTVETAEGKRSYEAHHNAFKAKVGLAYMFY